MFYSKSLCLEQDQINPLYVFTEYLLSSKEMSTSKSGKDRPI